MKQAQSSNSAVITFDQKATPTASATTTVWSGRVISIIAVLFLIFDSVIKVLQLAPAVDATVQLGYPEHLVFGIGVLELACLGLYVLPRTTLLGAVALTGYLGGAVATHVQNGSGLFPLVFPMILGGMLWLGLLLRDQQLRELVLYRR